MLVRSLLTLLLASFLTAPVPGRDAAAYVSQVYPPRDLYTGEGVLLEKGPYNLQLRWEKGHHSLAFLREEAIIALVNGQSHREEAGEKWIIPVVGTIFLRSTAQPIGTDEERHYSKTGRAQYEYEPRDWSATMRAYRSVDSENREVRFVLRENGKDGKAKRKDFVLFLDKN